MKSQNHIPCNQPVVDPRLLQLVAQFKAMDNRGKDTLLRMAAVMPKAVAV